MKKYYKMKDLQSFREIWKYYFLISILTTLIPLLTYSQQRWEVILNDEDLRYTAIGSDKSYDIGHLIYTNIRPGVSRDRLIKTNTNGEILWQKSIFYNNIYSSNLIVRQNQNGEILIGGTVDGHASLVMLDACGNSLWCNEFVNSDLYNETAHADAAFLENGNIITYTLFYTLDKEYDVGLMMFDSDGNLLWSRPFQLLEKYPLLAEALPIYFDFFNDYLIASGSCYYAYPDNPSVYWLRPMFIKTDSSYYEDWFLPYGLNDNIIGHSHGAISSDGITIRGYGSYYKHDTDTINSILMDFNMEGIETGFIGIDNNEIGPEVVDNFFNRIMLMDDTSYIATAKFGETVWDNPMGEWVMDTSGKVYQYLSHESSIWSFNPITRTYDDTYQFTYSYNNYYDILLVKLNPDLSQADYDTTTYVYDSLCDELPIISDTIYLYNCGIITSIEDEPVPLEDPELKGNIIIRVTPNPVANMANFKIENNERYKYIQLWCYDIHGSMVWKHAITSGQKSVNANTSNWQNGLYIVVAETDNGSRYSAKFLVK